MNKQQHEKIEALAHKYVSNIQGNPATWPLKSYMAGARRGYDKAMEEMGVDLGTHRETHGKEPVTEIVGPVKYIRGQLFDGNMRKIANVCEGFYGLGNEIANSLTHFCNCPFKSVDESMKGKIDKEARGLNSAHSYTEGSEFFPDAGL